MKRKKGQALVEFIIILPILIIILLGIVDFGLIFYNQNLLENNLEEVIDIFDKTKNIEKMQDFLKEEDQTISLNLQEENEYINIELQKEYEFLTPGLNLIFPSPYKIKAQRMVYNG